MTTVVLVQQGGTGSTHAAGARQALGVPSMTDMGESYSQANASYAQANAGYAQANSAYAQANSAYAQGNNAYAQANAAYSAANARVSTSGGSISGDLAITGNLTVTGNATTMNVSNLSVNDSIILLSTNAVGDSNDIGFIGHFDRGATATHAGLIRKATQNQFYLFDNYEVEPSNNVIDVSGNNFRVGNLRLGIINANSFVTSAGLNVTDQANSAFTAANNRVLKAGDTMTGQLNISSGGLLVTGNSNFDSGTLFVDSVNDRIGVGTLSPTGRLHSADAGFDPGNSNITKASFVASGNYGGGITLNDGGLGTIWMQSTGTVMGFAVGTTSGASGTMYMRNGSVGIAQVPTVSTTSSLFNNGDFTIAGSNRSILGNIYYSSGWKYAANGYGWGFRENASGLVQFITFPNNTSGAGAAATDTYLMTLDIPNQRVGIGTTSPTYRLDVDSTSGVRFKVATGGYNWINLVSGYTGQLSVGLNDNGGSGALAIAQYNSSGSFVRFALSLDSAGSLTSSTDMRAPIFYDSNDTNAYYDGGGAFIMRGGSPTIYFRDTDHNSAMLHNNSNLLYVLRGGNDTTTWTQVSSQWPFIFNLTNNDATCGGSFSAVGNVTAYSSDKRLKINIKNIPNALDKVLSLNGVTFDWVDRVKELGFTPDTMINDAGVIAQEVQEVLPQAVKPAPFDYQWDNDKNANISRSGENFITVQYEKIVPLLIEAIKELKAEIDTLKQRG